MALTPQLLPSGFLHTSGSQIVDSAGNPVRIASIGTYIEWGMYLVGYKTMLDNIKRNGFNCIRMMWVNSQFRNNAFYPSWFIDYTLNPDLVGLNTNQVQQKWVAYCRTIGLKVIFDNHTNSNWGLGQQGNGLWYDLGGASNNTDGSGTAGTTTNDQWVTDWANFAAQYAGNDTVIGYDLRNEPFGYDPNTNSTWQAGSVNPNHNIRWAYERAANAIFARVGGGPLIICEAVTVSGSDNGRFIYNNDLTMVPTNGVNPSVSNKVVYSVHVYPATAVGDGARPDSGQGAYDIWTAQWGFLVKQNIAPIWIGEVGDFLNYVDPSITAETRAWANAIVTYCNGLAPGGPSFSGSQQGISTDWWFAFSPSNGPMQGNLADTNVAQGIWQDWPTGTPWPIQQQYWSQLLYYGNGAGGTGGTGGPGGSGTATTSPNGTTVTTVGPAIIDANGNAYTITSGAQIAVNGVTDPVTGNVIELAYVSGLVWQLNTFGDWYSKGSPTDTWAGPTKTSPLGGSAPVASPDGTVINATGQAIIDANGNAWTLVNSTGPKNRIGAPIAGITVTTGAWTHGTVAGQDYALLLPFGYDSTHIYPVVMALHGNQLANTWYSSGGVTDGVVASEGAFWNNVNFRTRYPAIVVMPYCDQRSDATGLVVNFGGYAKADQFSESANVALLEYLFANYSCDRSRVYVTGTGTGGQGAWSHMIKYGVRAGQKALKRYFAASAPMDGWSIEWLPTDLSLVNQLRNDPIWAWNGDQDANSAPFDQSWYAAYGGVTPYNGTKAPNGQMKFTQVTGAAGSGRASGYTLGGTGNALFDWMFAQSLDTLAALPGSSVAINGTIDSTTSGATSTGATLLFSDEFSTFTGATNGSSVRNDWVPHYAFGGSEYTLSANNEAEAYVAPDRAPGINPFSVVNGALKITASAASSTGANDLGLPYNSGAMVSCLELNGSPVYTAPSNSAQIVLAGSGGTITDAGGAVWSISTGLAVLRNSVAAGFTANVAEIAYVGTTMWHQNTSGSWYSWDGVSTWNPGNNPVSQQGLFARQYGFFAAMMLLPKGRGYWPAWWLEPVDGGVGEIDIMEWLGHDTTTYYFSLHFQDASGNNTGSGDAITCTDASANWHEFAIDWQPDFITAYLDRRQVMQRATPSAMKKPYYMLTNLAVGAAGSWPGPPDGTTPIPNSMLIDYIRVYDKYPGPFTQSTASAQMLAFVSNKIWYLDSKGLWRSKTLPGDQWLPVAGTATAPIVTSGGGPVQTPQSTSWNLLGAITNWVANQAVTLGTRRSNNGLAYQVVVPGTTAASGGPTGTGGNIVDGTAHWKYLGNADFVTLTGATTQLPAVFTTDVKVSIWNLGPLTTSPATPIFNLTGHATGSNKLTLGCAPGESIRDSLLSQSIPLGYDATKGVALQLPLTPSASINYTDIDDPTVVLDGLQFRDPQSDSGSSILHSTANCTNLTVQNCIFDGFSQPGGATIWDLNGVNATFTNCLFIDRQPSGGTAPGIAINGTGVGATRFVNCTFVAVNAPAGALLFNGYNSFSGGIIKNCAIFGYGTICTAGFTLDHCAVSNAGLGSGTDGGSNLLNKVASSQFVNAQSDFRTLATSALVDAGAPATSDIPTLDDIAGTPRPGGPVWDIGCWERESFSIRDVRPPPISIW